MPEFIPISEIADIRRGASPRPIGDPIFFGGNIGWVRIVDVTRSKRFLRETEEYLSPIGEKRSIRVGKGDLIMSICGTIGRPIIIDMDACIHDGFVQFYNLKDTDTTYLYYVLQYSEPAFNGMGQPGTQTNLNTTLAGKHKIFSPAISEQRKIASILSAIDEIIEKSEILINKYQQIKAGMMHDLFTRGVDAHGRLRPSREQAPDLYKPSPVGWIPKEWHLLSIQELAAPTPGATIIGPFGSNLTASDYREEGVPVVFVRDVKPGEFQWISDVYVSRVQAGQLSAHLSIKGDILSTKMGLPPCITCIHPEWMPDAIITADIIRLRPNHVVVNSIWLSFAMNENKVMRQVQAITAGVTRPKITLADFRKILLALPPLDEQEIVANRLSTISDKIRLECEYGQKLQSLKSGLMHDLLTGRVRVKLMEDEAQKAVA
jgi:type I restriction enzyme S subunit